MPINYRNNNHNIGGGDLLTNNNAITNNNLSYMISEQPSLGSIQSHYSKYQMNNNWNTPST